MEASITTTTNSSPRILIIDDDLVIFALLNEILSEIFPEVAYANTGESGIAMALQFKPEVILLDIDLPDMSGIQVCQTLKTYPELVHVPVVFVTSLSEIENEAEAIKVGATGFIPKPPHRALVMANVHNALRLHSMNNEIQRLVDYRKKLTHMIVHDINNLLVVSLCSTEMLMSEESLPEGLKKLVQSAHKSTNDIQNMTASLLDVAKLESQTFPLNLKRINLSEMFQQRVDLVVAQIKTLSLKFSLQEKATSVCVLADDYLLMRIIDNLLFNAIKFSPPGGQITALISCADGQATLALSNDAKAIPEEYFSSIFAPFGQIEAQQTRGFRGVGLGLALCRMATQTMGGKITLESPIPPRLDGVCFHLTFPQYNS